MIYRQHLREMIAESLGNFDLLYPQKEFQFQTRAAVNLLVLTAVVETNAGQYLRQIKGPALGIYQIEPATLMDLYKNFLGRKQSLLGVVCQFGVVHIDSYRLQAMGNLPLQTIWARLIYYRHPDPLPKHNDIPGLAAYWKKIWNTSAGKGDAKIAEQKYLDYLQKQIQA